MLVVVWRGVEWLAGLGRVWNRVGWTGEQYGKADLGRRIVDCHDFDTDIDMVPYILCPRGSEVEALSQLSKRPCSFGADPETIGNELSGLGQSGSLPSNTKRHIEAIALSDQVKYLYVCLSKLS